MSDPWMAIGGSPPASQRPKQREEGKRKKGKQKKRGNKKRKKNEESAERSFTTLRRLKSWMRSRMIEGRMTGLAFLNVHLERR